MRLHLREASRVFIDLRATGLLRSVAHNPTLAARPERVAVEVTTPAEAAVEAVVEATFDANAIEAPADMSASDREKMVDNLRGREVLDAARFPTLAFRGRYDGTLDAGTLSGELQVRGTTRRVSMGIHVSREAGVLVVTGGWEGRLTDLGIRPFKALLGAIKLEDWVALRLDARFDATPP
jgi:polyisoprenoid-binding protein YceI